MQVLEERRFPVACPAIRVASSRFKTGFGSETPAEPLLAAVSAQRKPRRAGDLLGKMTWPEDAVDRVMTVLPSVFAGHVPEWLVEQARQATDDAMAKAWVEESEHERDRWHE